MFIICNSFLIIRITLIIWFFSILLHYKRSFEILNINNNTNDNNKIIYKNRSIFWYPFYYQITLKKRAIAHPVLYWINNIKTTIYNSIIISISDSIELVIYFGMLIFWIDICSNSCYHDRISMILLIIISIIRDKRFQNNLYNGFQTVLKRFQNNPQISSNTFIYP